MNRPPSRKLDRQDREMARQVFSPRRRRGKHISGALTAALVLSLATLAHAQSRETSEQQPTIQARPGGPEGAPKTDQTIDVTKGTRLVLTNNAGEVVVRSWERDQVRIQASHTGREQVEAQTTDMTLRVRARSQRGPSGLVDYQVTVPRWMPVNVSGT